MRNMICKKYVTYFKILELPGVGLSEVGSENK